MKRIVVPTDFSSTSHVAMSIAVDLAHKWNVELHIIHVYYPATVEFTEAIYVDTEASSIRENQLIQITEKWKSQLDDKYQNVNIEETLLIGFPAQEIKKYVEQEDIGLVVMGSTGEGGFIKKMFGSVSLQVLDIIDCPVFLVPHECKPSEFDQFLLTTAHGINDKDLVPEILKYASAYDATVHILNVNDDYKAIGLDELYDEFIASYPSDKVKLVYERDDDIEEEILEYCDEQRIDLLMMSSKKRGFFEKIFHKSMTRSMAVHAEVPLLVFKQ